MKKIVLLLIAFLIFQLGNANPIKITFTTEIADDATLSVLTEILQAKDNWATLLEFEKGTYHFYPEKAKEVYRYISNHDKQFTCTAFPLIGLNNIIVDGNGSRFIFHGVMIPFLVDGSNNVNIKNVSVDWATPFYSEATIVANNAANNTYDIQIAEKYPYEIRNGNLFFLKEYFEHTLGQMYIFDPKTKATAYKTQTYSTWYTISGPVKAKSGKSVDYKYDFSDDKYNPTFNSVGKELKSYFEEIEPGIVRVYHHNRDLPPVGMVMVMKGAKGVNRVAPAFHITQTIDFVAENVNVLHAGGMGIISENCTDVTLNNFNVIPSKGRLVSATADATHFIGCRGKLELLNCTLTNQLDDGTNIHGAYQEVVDIIDEHTLGIRTGHFQQKGFKIGLPGDVIGLLKRDKSLVPFAKITLKSLKMMNGAYMLATFNEKLPAGVKTGDLVENQAYPEVRIENCNFSKNRARGVLIASTKKSVVRNNYFHTDMEALLFPADMGHWYESGHAANVLIEGNTFEDCSYGGGKGGVIRVMATTANNEYPFRNINIINNKFERFDNLILDINCTDGFVFKGNEITNAGNFSALFPDLPAFMFHTSKNITFEHNSYSGKAKVLIETDKETPITNFQ